MPYIKKERREKLDKNIIDLQLKLASMGFIPGDYNYVISCLIGHWFVSDSESQYTTIAKITGTLDNVKQEFYRRNAAPYEDKAITRNGDIVWYNDFNKSL